MTASDKIGVDIVKKSFLSPSDKPIILEIFTNEEDEEKAMSQLIKANVFESPTGIAKKIIKGVIGDKGVEVLKTCLRK